MQVSCLDDFASAPTGIRAHMHPCTYASFIRLLVYWGQDTVVKSPDSGVRLPESKSQLCNLGQLSLCASILLTIKWG